MNNSHPLKRPAKRILSRTPGRALIALVAVLAGVGMLLTSVMPVVAADRPAAVTGFSVQAGDAPGELRVTWDAHPDSAVDYRVSWARYGQNFKKITDTDWNAFPVDNELTISGLWPGESYKVRVRARFNGPNGRWSQAVTGAAATDDPALKPAPPVTTRDHVTESSFVLDMMESINCGFSPCTKNETYSVSLTGGEQYVAEVWGSSTVGGGDANKLGIVAVESPNGTKLGSDLSGMSITLREPKVVFRASSVSGTHKVKVRIDGSEGTTIFRVVVYPHVPYDDCAADTDTVCTVTVGTALEGEFHVNSLSRSDVDWFKVDLTGGQLYEVVMRGDSRTHLRVRNPFLRGVYDHRGRLLHTDGTVYPHPRFGATQGTADMDSGPGNAALTYFTPISTGTFYVGVTSAGGKNRAGHYVLTVRTFETDALANDDCHPGMNAEAFKAYSEVVFRQMYGQRLGIPPTQADYDAASVRTDGDMTDCEIQVGQTVTGYIEHNGLLALGSYDIKVSGDKDWFKVTLSSGKRYRIEIETRNGGIRRPDLGGIYNSSGNRPGPQRQRLSR